MRKQLLLVFILLITIFACHLTYGKANLLKFRKYGLSLGLSQSTVVSMVQDHQGFLWFGTQDGLNRFDGYQFKVFQHEMNDPSSLSSNYIAALHVDKKGELWIGTSKGLHRYNKQTATFTPYILGSETRENKGSQYINKILSGPDNKLWIGTYEGLFLFDPISASSELFENKSIKPNSSDSQHIYAMFTDNKNQLWVGTSQGLNRLDLQSKTFKSTPLTINQKGSPSGDSITDIVQDKSGHLWVATYRSGLIKFDPLNNKITPYQHNTKERTSISHNRVRSLLIDRFGTLWIGTANGLNIYDTEQDNFIRYYNDPAIAASLSNDYIWDILEDNNDSVWFGTSNGVNQFVHSTLKFGHRHKMPHANIGLSHNHVRSLFKSADNTLWVGVDNGLNKYDPISNSFTYYQHDPNDKHSISAGMVMSVFADSNNRVWAGTYNNGLNLLNNNQQFTHFTHDPNNKNTLSHNRVYAISEDQNGFLWIGTLNGLNRFDPEEKTFTRFYHQPSNTNSLSGNSIYAISPTPTGDLWIATRNSGITRFDPKSESFQRFEYNPANNNSISHNRVFSLYQKGPDELWAATANGLNKLTISTKHVTRYYRQQGLLNNTIYAVTGDEHGLIWFSTNRGLSRYDPINNQFKHFDLEHGLQSNEFNNGAFYKAADGELFFGGINGLNRFYPYEIKDNTMKPDVEITQFYLANKAQEFQKNSPLSKTINQTQSITLDHTQAVFSFEFTALHFTNPARNNFTYILEGFDKEWTQTNAQYRRATYTNLPAGNYSFKVKAANSDNLWGDISQPIQIKITPAPWKTIWAYLFYAMVLCSTLGAFAFQRYRKQQAIKESENRLSLALWSSGNEFWDWNTQKNTLVRSNNSHIFSLPSGENFSIDAMKALVHPDDFENLKTTFIKHLNQQSDYFEYAYRLRNNLNQWTWVLDRGKVVQRDEKNFPIRVLGTIQNINDLKTIEEQLRQLNEELETRVENRTTELATTVDELATTLKQLTSTQLQLVKAEKMAALGGLVSGISHEINTPVGICITSSSALESAIETFFQLQAENKLTRAEFETFKQTCQYSLSLVSRNLQRTAELVQSFKLVAVDQAGDTPSKCNIKQFFQYIIDGFENQLAENKTKLNFICEADLEINCFSASLELVLTQLIHNSLQHGIEKNGAGLIDISVFTQNHQMIINYQDNGSGLATSNNERMFEPFYTTLRNQGHTGLGMHIVFNHITQRLNGSIEINKNTTQGLAFTITIPVL